MNAADGPTGVRPPAQPPHERLPVLGPIASRLRRHPRAPAEPTYAESTYAEFNELQAAIGHNNFLFALRTWQLAKLEWKDGRDGRTDGYPQDDRVQMVSNGCPDGDGQGGEMGRGGLLR